MRFLFAIIVLVFVSSFVFSNTFYFAEQKSVTAHIESMNLKLLTVVKESVVEEKVVNPSLPFEEQTEELIYSHLNNLRNRLGLNILSDNVALRQLAREHSEYRYSVGSVGHINPNGDLGTRVSRVVTYNTTGENVSYCGGFNTPESVASCIMQVLAGSSGHYANMVNTNYDYVGIGVYGKNSDYYATQIFVG